MSVGIFICILHNTATAAPATVDEIFQLLDSDGDQLIQHVEYRLNKVTLHSLFDSDQNFYVERDETALSPEAFASADSDRDGRMSGFEFVDSPLASFNDIDANEDGVITLEEMTSFVQQIRN